MLQVSALIKGVYAAASQPSPLAGEGGEAKPSRVRGLLQRSPKEVPAYGREFAVTDKPSWSEDDSDVYRNIARYAVPERERQIEIVTALVRAAAADGDVLDLCCGEGLLSEAIMAAMPEVKLLAYDGSDTMLAETRRRVPDPDRLTTKRIELAAADWRSFETPLKAVVSSLAIHHLDDR